MKTIRLWAALTAALFLSVRSLPSQCTHTTVQAIGATMKASGVQACGGGVTIKMHGLTLRLGHCPLFVMVTPPHHKSVPEAGCGTDAVVGGRLPLQMIRFRCRDMDILFYEIRWCQADPPMVVGMVEDFVAQPCQ